MRSSTRIFIGAVIVIIAFTAQAVIAALAAGLGLGMRTLVPIILSLEIMSGIGVCLSLCNGYHD